MLSILNELKKQSNELNIAKSDYVLIVPTFAFMFLKMCIIAYINVYCQNKSLSVTVRLEWL